MKWLYFTRGNGDIDTIPEKSLSDFNLTKADDYREFTGDTEAKRFNLQEPVKNPLWDSEAQEYVSDNSNEVPELIEAQWNAANTYEQSKLSPNGFSICYQHKDISPKAAAIIQWVDDLWNDVYYVRRQEIVDGGNPSTDYSGCGDLPYSFAEAQQEIKAAQGGA